jgi:hypothetical protein
MEMINAVFRQRTEHKYAYDAETLILRLKNAGFGKVAQQSFGQSFGPPPPDLPSRKSESLYVEAVK